MAPQLQENNCYYFDALCYKMCFPAVQIQAAVAGVDLNIVFITGKL